MSKDNGVSLKAMLAQNEVMAKRLEELEAALAAKSKSRKMTVAMGKAGKGNLCIYGLQRWPFSFYRQQIETILDNADEIRAFIKAHASELSSKSED